MDNVVSTLLALKKNNEERVALRYLEKLGRLLQDITSLKNTIAAAEAKLKQEDREKEQLKVELQEIVGHLFRWQKGVTRLKDQMQRQKGMTLKEMLEIQQLVAKTEENQLLNEARALVIQKELADFIEERQRILVQTKELKRQYNEQAKEYNAVKTKLDLQRASYDFNEEGLLEELDPSLREIYRAALEANPTNPISYVESGICTGCRLGLPNKIVKSINKGIEFYSCENCRRVLIPK